MTATLFHEWWNSPAAPFLGKWCPPLQLWMWLSTFVDNIPWTCLVPHTLGLKVKPTSSVKRTRPECIHNTAKDRVASCKHLSEKLPNYTNNEDTHFPNSIFALTLFFKQEDFNAGSLCVCFLPRWRGAEKPKEEQWGRPENDNNCKSLPPSNRETREEVQKESLGADVCCWKLEPWRGEPSGRCSCFWRCHPVRNKGGETPNLILSSHHPSPASDSR